MAGRSQNKQQLYSFQMGSNALTGISEELALGSMLFIFISDIGDCVNPTSSKSSKAYAEGSQKPLGIEKDYVAQKSLKVTLNNCDLMSSNEFRK